jgi:hypothetical protein
MEAVLLAADWFRSTSPLTMVDETEMDNAVEFLCEDNEGNRVQVVFSDPDY